jgi:hypothetical protein
MGIIENLKKSTLVLGPLDSPKTALARTYIDENTKKGKTIIYLATTDFPEDIEKGSKGNALFVDCYSRFVGVFKKDTDNILRLDGPKALLKMSLAISDTLNAVKGPIAAIIEAGPIFVHNSPRAANRFFHQLTLKLNSRSASYLILLEENEVNENVVEFLKSVTSSMITFNDKKININGKNVSFKIRNNKLSIGKLRRRKVKK